MSVRAGICAAALLMLGGCGTKQPVATSSSCGYAYILQAGSSTIPSDSCAGVIPSDPTRVTISNGERFSINVEHEETGALDAPVPLPSGADVALLRRRGAVIEYAANRVGTVNLVAHHTRFCIGIDPRIGSCTAFVVHVVR